MATKENLSQVEIFANELISIPQAIEAGLLKSFDDQDMKNVVTIYAPILVNQFKEVSELIMNSFNNGSAQEKKDATDLLRTASGLELVKSAKSISKNLKSISSKLGLNSIIKEIKKLILFLLDLFNAPKWLIDIILIIDQILNALFGLDLPTTMPAILSKMEVFYLKELESHSDLKKARKDLFSNDDE
ncbi:hypothetical protein [Lacinutrix salivirga]